MNHSKVVHPKPHRREDAAWRAIQKVLLLYPRRSKNHYIDQKSFVVHMAVKFWIFFPVTFAVLQVSHVLLIDYVIIVLQIMESEEQIGLKHFKPIKPLGSGDTGRFLPMFPFSNFVSNFHVNNVII